MMPSAAHLFVQMIRSAANFCGIQVALLRLEGFAISGLNLHAHQPSAATHSQETAASNTQDLLVEIWSVVKQFVLLMHSAVRPNGTGPVLQLQVRKKLHAHVLDRLVVLLRLGHVSLRTQHHSALKLLVVELSAEKFSLSAVRFLGMHRACNSRWFSARNKTESLVVHTPTSV
jgi:hypothetical protein